MTGRLAMIDTGTRIAWGASVPSRSHSPMPNTVSATPNALGIDDAFVRLYAELKRIARAQRRRRGDTLNTTALVHDLYLSMAARREFDLGDPARLYAYAAKAMRHLLIDRARARARLKSGGDLIAIELPGDGQGLLDPLIAHPERAFELDSALSALAHEDARAAEVVELYGRSEQVAASVAPIRRRP